MTIHIELPEIQSLDYDEHGLFLRLQLYCADGQATIRWGIDRFTYKSLQKQFAAINVTVVKGIRLTFEEFWNSADQRFLVQLVIRNKANQAENAFFACTSLFVANLRWLKNLSSLKEVHHLRWAGIPSISAQSQPSITPKRNSIKRGHFNLLWGVLPLLGIFFWLGAHVHNHNSSILSNEPLGRQNRLSVTGEGSLATVTNMKHTNPNQLELSHPSPPSIPPSQAAGLSKTAPAVSPSAVSNPSAVQLQADLSGKEVWELPAGYVALTFDDGPSAYTDKILSILNRYHVHATFFFVGSRVPLWISSVKNVAAAGDGIGNHSMTHPQLTQLSPKEQQFQIIETNRVLQQVTGVTPTLFRPPYEEFNGTTISIIQENHMKLALWNRDPKDWEAATAQQIVNRILQGHPSGGVFDLHEKALTVQALPSIIEGLQKMDLKFVVLSKTVQN